jgi:hypothetical protein
MSVTDTRNVDRTWETPQRSQSSIRNQNNKLAIQLASGFTAPNLKLGSTEPQL